MGVGPGDNFLFTLNELAEIPFPLGPGPVTAFKTDDAYSGTYACKLVSGFYGLGVDIFIPGMLGTSAIVQSQLRSLVGKPCAGCKPLHLKGYFKFEPVSGDSCIAVCLVSKWNAATHHRDTIGFGKQVFTAPVEVYTPFDVQLTYTTSTLVPDSLTILCISSAGFSVINFMEQTGQVGSTMYVDELMLEYPAGIEQVLMPEVDVKVYPVPAKETVEFEISRMVSKGVIRIINSDGKTLKTIGLNGLKNPCPLNNLSNGIYYFKLESDGHVMNTGSFVVQK